MRSNLLEIRLLAENNYKLLLRAIEIRFEIIRIKLML